MAQLCVVMVPDSLRHRYLRLDCAVYYPSLCMAIGHHSLIETLSKALTIDRNVTVNRLASP